MTDHNDQQDLDARLLEQMRQDFLEEASDLLDQLNLHLIQLEEEPDSDELANQVFRIAHTVKGSAGFAGLEEMSAIGRRMEDLLGEIRKGRKAVSSSFIQAMFDGLDLLTLLREKAAAGDASPVDITPVLRGLERAAQNAAAQDETPGETLEKPSAADHELFEIYKGAYSQLAALKHLVYSSVHLYDEDTLAALFSKQIAQKMRPERNSVWLVKNSAQVVEIARDGKLVPEDYRQTIAIDTSPAMQRLINDQHVIWSSSAEDVTDLLPGFASPVIMPIKAKPAAYGFLALDPRQPAEVEVYQFVAEFAAMMLRVSKLHRKVDEQRKELDEMTAILFRQNNILSSLYHVELDLMRVKNPVDLCRILAEAFVHDLETRSAAIFIKDEEAGRLRGIWGSGGLQDIPSLSFSRDEIVPFGRCLETGRIVSQIDFSASPLRLGPNDLTNWVVMGLKGRTKTHGVIAAELDVGDVTDSMSILANYSGILLDNLILENRTGISDGAASPAI
ncbi:MAG: Hpt domain-containing protein [Desulfobulbaceae bacterium]|jgi:HPt (histidine-containing phosphotransfer) domain-containing protein|nr:Hpt domain-containing protein [Desulfobulbaceae bacterium]MDY0350576.1 Hpt domain-containing protein [Desulfobulbaceae bacterium]